MHTKTTERFAELFNCESEETWRELIFKLGCDLGYTQTLLAIFPDRNSPIEARFAFLHSNYSSSWLNKYHTQKLGHLDPVATHCVAKSTPLVWSPAIFTAPKQKEMYEEACGHGLRSGVTLPIHGSNNEMGILSFVSDSKPNKRFLKAAHNTLPELSYFRDFVFETSLRFMKMQLPLATSPSREVVPDITPSELECLKWCVVGKSSWDISQILHCSSSTVNYHFANLRRKFGVSSRQQVVVRAMRAGLRLY